MEKKTYTCDICGKDLGESNNQAQAISAVIQVVQGIRPEVLDLAKSHRIWEEGSYAFLGSTLKYPSWKHRDNFGYIICGDCCGEKITINCGDNFSFSLANVGKILLKRLKIIR